MESEHSIPEESAGKHAFNINDYHTASEQYTSAANIYYDIGNLQKAFSCHHQALFALGTLYNGFLNKYHNDFLNKTYFLSLETFLERFKDTIVKFPKLEPMYLKKQYLLLQAYGYKARAEGDHNGVIYNYSSLINLLNKHPLVFSGNHYRENRIKFELGVQQTKIPIMRTDHCSYLDIANQCSKVVELCTKYQGQVEIRESVLANKHNYLSLHHRYTALHWLRLNYHFANNEVISALTKARDNAIIAHKYFLEYDYQKSEKYKENVIFSELLLAFSKHQIAVSMLHMADAITTFDEVAEYASYFVNHNKGNRIFPRFFIDFEELLDERLILNFYIHFQDFEFEKATDSLFNWLSKNKYKMEGNWKYGNVYIRYLISKCFCLKDNIKETEKILRQADSLLRTNLLGNTARTLVTLTKDIIKFQCLGIYKDLDFTSSPILRKITELIPIHARTKEIIFVEKGDEIIPLEYLPPIFEQLLGEIKITQPSTMQEEFEKVVFALHAYLAIICDYRIAKYKIYKNSNRLRKPLATEFESQLESDLLNLNPKQLFKLLMGLLNTHGECNEYKKYFNLAERIIDSISKTQNLSVPYVLELKNLMIEFIKYSYMKCFPHLILVTGHANSVINIDGDIYIGKRLWQHEQSEALICRGVKQLDIDTVYYVGTKFKRKMSNLIIKGNIVDLLESKVYLQIVDNKKYGYLLGLRKLLMDLEVGKLGWQEYEKIVFHILKSLLIPPLRNPLCQESTTDGSLRFDAVFNNDKQELPWKKVSGDFVLFEFKNVLKLEVHHVDQVYKYMKLKGNAFGNLAFIVTRNSPPSNVCETQKFWFRNDGTCIIILTDCDLNKMIDIKLGGGNPSQHIEDLYSAFILKTL